jgi:hypothetical protein
MLTPLSTAYHAQEEARKLNSDEVAEEDRKSKMPANSGARKARAQYEESVEKAKKVCVCVCVFKLFLHRFGATDLSVCRACVSMCACASCRATCLCVVRVSLCVCACVCGCACPHDLLSQSLRSDLLWLCPCECIALVNSTQANTLVPAHAHTHPPIQNHTQPCTNTRTHARKLASAIPKSRPTDRLTSNECILSCFTCTCRKPRQQDKTTSG